MLLTAVSLAVAAIPEAAGGGHHFTRAGGSALVRQNALIRRRPRERVGHLHCSDKTGTLTLNQMQVDCVLAAGEPGRAAGRGGAIWRELGMVMRCATMP
jgi:Ca2+-transporting ATPase